MKRVIISGGGTGGHVFPGIAIANALRKRYPAIEILFIGAEGRMEMEKVPAAGYAIVGLPITGIQRRLSWRNLMVPFQLLKSLRRAKNILKEFKPNVVVGVGGYASGPALLAASKLQIPTLIQEQNSFPGITNKYLAKKVATICVAYPAMEQFFPRQKLVLTGNPIRADFLQSDRNMEAARMFFSLSKERMTVLVVGGSLGARTINECVAAHLNYFKEKGVQLIWQTGKGYYSKALEQAEGTEDVRIFDFISRMDMAYSAADIVVSRAGAIAISELCFLGKPSILIPSPFVSEDHQTKNAKSLEERNAAILLREDEAMEKFSSVLDTLLIDEQYRKLLSKNACTLGIPDAAEKIVDEMEKLSK